MSQSIIFLLLIYGYAMITMGMFAVLQRDTKLIDLYLVKSLKFLGFFGITHGLSEWTTMIIRLELYPDLSILMTNINQITKAISFTFLLYFGLDMLPLREKYKKIVLKIPIVSLVIYLGGFSLLIAKYGLDNNLSDTKFNIIMMRYIMGFLSCLISAVALYLNAWLIEKTKSIQISRRYKNLAGVFIIYGILEGILIAKGNFFPASLINRELFVEYFHFTPLYIKAFVGFIITFLLIKVIDTFTWEQEEKISQLEKNKIASKERRKLGLEIHDSIIQELYAAGLKIEYLTMNKDEDRKRDILAEIKNDLNNAIKKTREFISTTALGRIKLEDFNDNLTQLVHMFNENQSIKISLKCNISPYTTGYLSPDKSTQIYYIIQEAISNVIKHSEADEASVLLEGRHDFLYITIIDNGKGISQESINSDMQFGISSMQDRAERAGGVFIIRKPKKGTRLEIRIPWEKKSAE